MSEVRHGYGLYWRTWLILLGLTLLMLFVDSAPVSRLVFLGILLGAMLIKAGLIGANFMHLRFEKAVLALSVTLALLLTGLALFILIGLDAARSARLSTQGGSPGVQVEKSR